jgi:hypothetical protein
LAEEHPKLERYLSKFYWDLANVWQELDRIDAPVWHQWCEGNQDLVMRVRAVLESLLHERFAERSRGRPAE